MVEHYAANENTTGRRYTLPGKTHFMCLPWLRWNGSDHFDLATPQVSAVGFEPIPLKRQLPGLSSRVMWCDSEFIWLCTLTKAGTSKVTCLQLSATSWMTPYGLQLGWEVFMPVDIWLGSKMEADLAAAFVKRLRETLRDVHAVVRANLGVAQLQSCCQAKCRLEWTLPIPAGAYFVWVQWICGLPLAQPCLEQGQIYPTLAACFQCNTGDSWARAGCNAQPGHLHWARKESSRRWQKAANRSRLTFLPWSVCTIRWTPNHTT